MQRFTRSIPFFFSMFLLFPSLSVAQGPAVGPQQVITTGADDARSVFAADLDGDGDKDVLSASAGDNKIAWYKNTDGLGAFGPQQVITTATSGARSVYAADLDGDGDMDVLSASFGDNKVAWYENTDGQGNFGAQQVITTAADGAWSVYAADLDGDGDLDVLSASKDDNKIAWYENTDGLGNFGAQQVITTALDGAISVYAADLDGDSDMDVLSASVDDGKIAWYENTDGLGNFGVQQVITTAVDAAISVYAADLDGDGDMDVLSASALDDKIAWYENFDGQGAFGPQQVITTDADGAHSVFAADLDGDSDLDVLSASRLDDKIAWYENTDGLGNFGVQQVITTEAIRANSVFAADLDGDSDMDVLSASFIDDKIAWYENLIDSIDTAVHGPATEIFEFALRPNYPNPFNPETIIRYQLARTTEVKLEIYNLVGQKLTTLVDKKLSSGAHSVTWHGLDALGRPVASGVYIYRLQTDSFVESKKMLLLR